MTSLEKMYFVSARKDGATIFAGHWLALDAAVARSLAKAAYTKGDKIRKSLGWPDAPKADDLEFIARRSDADQANAMNEAAL